MWQFWLIAAGVFFIVEMATVGFLVFWFGVGALITMLFSFFIDNIYIQACIFLFTSTLLVFLTKPLVNRFIIKNKTVPTNTYSIIGKNGLVTQEINPIKGTGQVKIGTEVWSAKSVSEQIIPKDATIEVLNIDGVKVVVKLISMTKVTIS